MLLDTVIYKIQNKLFLKHTFKTIFIRSFNNMYAKACFLALQIALKDEINVSNVLINIVIIVIDTNIKIFINR